MRVGSTGPAPFGVVNLSALLPLVEESGALPPLDGIRALGVPDPAKPPVIAAIGRRHRAPVVVVTARPQRALNLADELRAWLGDGASVLLFPERDALPYERIQPDPLSVHERLRALHALAGATRAPLVVVASALALAQRTLAPDDMGRTVALRKGSRIALDAFLRELDALGYEFLAVADRRARLPGAVGCSISSPLPRRSRTGLSCGATRSRVSAAMIPGLSGRGLRLRQP